MSLPVLSTIVRATNGINTAIDLAVDIAELTTDGIKGGMNLTRDHFSLIKERSDEYLAHQRSDVSRDNRKNERMVSSLEDARHNWKSFKKATKSKMLFADYLKKYNSGLYEEFKDVLTEEKEQPKENTPKAAQVQEDNNK